MEREALPQTGSTEPGIEAGSVGSSPADALAPTGGSSSGASGLELPSSAEVRLLLPGCGLRDRMTRLR